MKNLRNAQVRITPVREGVLKFLADQTLPATLAPSLQAMDTG